MEESDCNICLAKLQSVRGILQHMQDKHNEAKYQCQSERGCFLPTSIIKNHIEHDNCKKMK